MVKLIIFTDPNVRVHRRGETFTDALSQVSQKLITIAEKIIYEKWERGQLVKREDVTTYVKAYRTVA
jgi:hypothetical protein